jgi:hypothetical protein
MLLILDMTPEQVVQWPQRVDLEICEWISLQWPADILKPPANDVHGLHLHPLFVPVRPDQLKQARLGKS